MQRGSARIGIGILGILGVIIVLFLSCPEKLTEVYLKNYIVDSICLIISIFLLLVLYAQKKVDIFSPPVLFSLIYILMFFVTPIYDLITGEILWFGHDLFEYGIKGSMYALLGYCVFLTAYSCKVVFSKNDFEVAVIKQKKIWSEKHDNTLITFILLGYMVCLGANIFYMVYAGGNSIMYILTLGILGESNATNTLVDIGAVSMLSYALPSFTLLYIEYGKSKLGKVIAFIVMFELQVARGFRFFVLQIVAMFGAYYYIKRNKKPKFFSLISLLLLTLIPLLLMTLFRTTIRTGEGMDLTLLSGEVLLDAFDAAFWENLRIYKNYYALIKVVPDYTSYLFGAQMIIYTIIMFIPRAIWKGKPGNPGTEAQQIALGDVAVRGGSAYPGLGEYYYEFGVFGIIFWMSVFGAWMRRIEKRYRYQASSRIDQMIYCTLLGGILQLVIRGYTPSNFWMIVFAMLPYWIIKKIFLKRRYA